MDRRAVLGAMAATTGMGLEAAQTRHGPSPKRAGHGFLWGTAGAAYQIEGGNVASDVWLLEHLKPSLFKEPSGDAADTIHRYRDDIALAAALGYNAHRFSIEWSRIEPERGQISLAALAVYRDMLETIRRHGMTPFVTFNHFTTPRWFAAGGGFSTKDGIVPFVAYCRLLTERLGELFELAATFNEPNLIAQLAWSPSYRGIRAAFDRAKSAGARAADASVFAAPILGDWQVEQPIQIEAHNRACEAIHNASSGRIKVGVTLALTDERAPATGPSGVERKLSQTLQPWLDARGDWIGVQNYTYAIVGPDGDLPPPAGAEMTQMNYPFAPDALERVIRTVAARYKRPIYVTEHGIATEDDTRRIAYLDGAEKAVANCRRDGIDLRGYLHWSLLDNWEWFFGYRPRFGLVAIDRQTFARTPKPSARHLGKIARRHLA